MSGKVRRIVTGVNASGRSCIVSDTLLPTAEVAPGSPVRAGLWTTDSAPASNKGAADPVPDGIILRTPPDHRGGSVIRVTDIVPDKLRAYELEELRRRGCKTTPERSARHPAFPRPTPWSTRSASRAKSGRSWTKTRLSCDRATC